MDLREYEHVRANNLSGGNKRKLSVAMALIGNPPLVFLDEPSTGVDPQAKRFMWNIVSKISTQGKKSAVIITTHSMEEAEALCTKMGIMCAGEFKCFGSSTHIKDKYGTGYELEIKIKTLSEEEVIQMSNSAQQRGYLPFNQQNCKRYLKDHGFSSLAEEIHPHGIGHEFCDEELEGRAIDPAEFFRWSFTESQGNLAIDHLEQKFTELTIIEHFGSTWKLKSTRDQYSIGFLFGMMEDIQEQFNISEYSVAQTTLEQIFNTFALQAEIEQHGGAAGRRRQSSKRITSKPTTGAPPGLAPGVAQRANLIDQHLEE